MKRLSLFTIAVVAMVAAASCGGRASRAELPVGVFDSGTGGLTVLEKILTLDAFDNATGLPGADGIPDFGAESFEYLADQANMPYGVYDAQGRSGFLRRLILDDASFLLSDRYFRSSGEERAGGRKRPCKIIVIACNTATAYGLGDVRSMLESQGGKVRVIGVINAGAKAALDLIGASGGPLAIGVLATPGTVSSGAYERTLAAMAAERGLEITVVSQSGYGFAEAVDNEPDYVDARLSAPRPLYRGPRIGTGDGDLIEGLLDVYGFDPDGLLYRGAGGGLMTDIQLNSAANYARFNLVSLVERYRLSGARMPLRAIILGCTHYPFQLHTLRQTLDRLRTLSVDGVFPYRDLIAEDLVFIDPAEYTAAECYTALRSDGLLARPRRRSRTVDAYISVPSGTLEPSVLTPEGQLSFEYKYGREPGMADPGTRFVLFSDDNIDATNRERIRQLLPECHLEIFAD